MLIGQAFVDVILTQRAFPSCFAGARAIDAAAGLCVRAARALLCAVFTEQVDSAR